MLSKLIPICIHKNENSLKREVRFSFRFWHLKYSTISQMLRFVPFYARSYAYPKVTLYVDVQSFAKCAKVFPTFPIFDMNVDIPKSFRYWGILVNFPNTKLPLKANVRQIGFRRNWTNQTYHNKSDSRIDLAFSFFAQFQATCPKDFLDQNWINKKV